MNPRPPAEPPAEAFWAGSEADLLRRLEAQPSGLTSAEAADRLARFGPNAVRGGETRSVLGLLARQFANPLVLVLLGAALVSALLHEYRDAEIIAGIVLAAGLLGFSQEYRAAGALERLRARIENRSTVLRDGAPVTLPSDEIVPGDVILLAAGSLVPADARVLEARDCAVAEAALTGEPYPVEKAPGTVAATAPLAVRSNAVFLGTSVRNGTARILVVRTGPATEFGAIAHRLQREPPETEFERGLRAYGHLLTRVMAVFVLLVFAANVLLERPPIDALLFAIALAIGMSPELLPAIVSVMLATGARAMAARGVIVRKLSAIENLGAMEVLCTDKTGTLTEGRMALEAAVAPDGAPSGAVLRLALANATLQTGLPNPLDEALVAEGTRRGLAPGLRLLDEAPFDFSRRRLSVLAGREADGRDAVLITKGALAEILDVCDKMGDAPLDAATRAALEARFAAWAGDGLRVLGLASRALPGRTRCDRADETEMRFEGFLLFRDPPKADVAQTIGALAGLGVRLKIVTGDNRIAAVALACAVGMGDPVVLTGEEIDRLGPDALRHQAEEADVFAEIDPVRKERIILALKRAGRAVGYMGDGINDAPALRAADVGISVDGATDVAKEAADLVLLEQDLAVLREGVELGRRTFANTMKYIAITTSANFGNMLSMAAASLVLPFLPLLATQILLNNLLSSFPAMTIAGDRVDPEAVARPIRWDMARVRRSMLVFGPISSFFDLMTFAVLIGAFAAGPELFRTAWFTESLLTQILIALVIRTHRPLWESRPARLLALASVAVAGVALVFSYTPLAPAFGFVPLPLPVLAAVAAITLGYLAASEGAKRWLGGVMIAGGREEGASR